MPLLRRRLTGSEAALGGVASKRLLLAGGAVPGALCRGVGAAALPTQEGHGQERVQRTVNS